MQELICERCKSCGRKSEKSHCDICRRRKIIEEKKQAGICRECSEPIVPGKTMCHKHLAGGVARTAKKKQAGICIKCSEPAMSGKVRCHKHLAADVARTTKKIQVGICIKCSEPAISGKTMCHKHLAASSARKALIREQRALKGLCMECGLRPLIVRENHMTQQSCEICYLKKTSRDHLKNGGRWLELGDLFIKQKGKCPYTGRNLVLGVSTSLDHRIPKALNGTNDLDNLQWVLPIINAMKWDNSESDFISLVLEVAEHRKSQMK